MSIWVRDEAHEKRYGYPVYRAAFGPWSIRVLKGPGWKTWGVEWVGDYDQCEDAIGDALTLHEAQRVAIDWVLKQILAVSSQVEAAAVEWQAQEQSGTT